ncbi:short chain dehydrogenase [Listeria sp. FSL L7-0233]|uniref:Short chain dehydrogenase n=1 Tax=Listeria cossartiae subsp. cayugensis TaxID=2713505 RepID=A0A7X0ZD21_9LIST|nr:short chain dehydrogenase [Listeria cossartiae]MBC1546732.1 short chain dehydrogenase [Listeria cossartiae subsp. cossartiae]MBC1550303.1 short chain dehydrogenase [Listeria cossartiae subsp. cossartiae]MBC1572663.1 short chain dehydrogenase [Listeria cossartiae subsp. cossartiae]MBC2183206.1 short chain dehydrogenase [Listeria cossartiae subsp. cossartiae]MBC2185993.1 short chain dehydrogenase [Listeria cossartiae subsp. cossartiae]
MKILLIGASGTLGSAVKDRLEKKADVITAGRHSGDVTVDITSIDSIKKMYAQVGKVDAIVSATGSATFSPLTELTPEKNAVTISSKLGGQINLVLLGIDSLNDHGSFTLTTGIMMEDPIVQGASAAMANGAVTAFAKSAAIEMPRGIRINTVSPNVLEESWDKLEPFFQGFLPVPAAKVARAFEKSVFGAQTGQSYQVY